MKEKTESPMLIKIMNDNPGIKLEVAALKKWVKLLSGIIQKIFPKEFAEIEAEYSDARKSALAKVRERYPEISGDLTEE